MRKIAMSFVGAVSVVMMTAAVGWACTNLATLNPSANSAAPGSVLSVTGTAFATEATGGQQVVLHWDSPDGPELATTSPDATGTVSASFTVPADAPAGPHVVVATQERVDSGDGSVSPAYGTPARTSILVGTPAAPAAPPDAAVAPIATAGEPIWPLVLTIGVGILGVGLFAAGSVLLLRDARRRPAPEPAKERQVH